jgi:hypothetical protein
MSSALLAMLAGAMSVGTSGCVALPFLGAIPSVVNFAYNLSKKSGDDADAKNPDAEADAADASKPAPKPLTADNVCHLMAIARPDLMVVELRKNATGAPEYRELRLEQGVDNARWNPVIDSEAGPDGWRPAVNFLKMDFKPSLTEVIPDTGTCYLAYVPMAADPSGALQPEFQTGSGDAAGAFSWAGREYQYKVARTLPCLSPSS